MVFHGFIDNTFPLECLVELMALQLPGLEFDDLCGSRLCSGDVFSLTHLIHMVVGVDEGWPVHREQHTKARTPVGVFSAWLLRTLTSALVSDLWAHEDDHSPFTHWPAGTRLVCDTASK